MPCIDRLPAIPLLASDPYLSIWMPADTMTRTDSCHWSGPVKPIRGVMTVDGKACRFLGTGPEPEAELTELKVTATRTRFVCRFGGVQLETCFATPALPDDPDLLSMPVTLVTFAATAPDGAAHEVQVRLHLSDRLCYDGDIRPAMNGGELVLDGRKTAWCGQLVQKPLSHSGDHVTIDWGYLYLTADGDVHPVGDGVQAVCTLPVDGPAVRAVIAYDDIASINYFGDLCKAWYRRDGRQITDAIRHVLSGFEDILDRCARMDATLADDALAAGGADYVALAEAAWRQTFAAHKLIATPKGEMAFLSKENDSNGCIGTVDVSYPSIPLFLRYCPELVNALCRPVLEFACMPVWTDDFAPHDVGRYPLATGQVYAARRHVGPGQTYPPYYLYPAGTDVYDPAYQMPVDGPAVRAVIAYDDIASINYFGDLCKAWYRRDGRQITDAIRHVLSGFEDILDRCARMDATLADDALAAGGADYVALAEAAWRQTFAAHKLIATPKGEMAFLSKENDSNGCIGTVDVSYPSIPLFLRYCPELVNALCRPVLEFACMPVWTDDFAPHDVGRYPLATGQVYAARRHVGPGQTYPPYYLYPAGTDVYDPAYQMPVEECGNMLIMLEAARTFGADPTLAETYRPLLDKWVRYLMEYGEDPDEQLCTDDFAGHLAHNVNLAAKAMVGVACYARLTGNEAAAEQARGMAARLLEKIGAQGNTPLTLDGKGWSMKYNLLWDKVLGLGLMPEAFYAAETASYLPRINTYGLPLDSRADYTKSDWICWTAAMAEDPKVRTALIAPVARTLRETTTRVPFSDWYDTKTGRYVAFIARSVQGGVYALLLRS